MEMIATRPSARDRVAAADARRRIREVLYDVVLDSLGPAGPDGLSPFEREILSDGLDRAVEAATARAIGTLNDEFDALLRVSPRPLLSKVERLRDLVDYGFD